MKTGAVIVAAGLSSRMGDFKPLLEIGSISIIERIIATLKQAAVSPIVVVTGFKADLLERHIAKEGVICLRNNDYATTQMFDSVCIGFRYINDICDRLLFTPVDIPMFTVNTVERLMEVDKPLVSPICNGEEGHPLLIDCKLLPQILNYRGNKGLKGALDFSSAEKTLLEVPDKGILYDADTPQDYQRLLNFHNEQFFRPIVNLSLAKEKVFFEEKTALLLQLITRTGSVSTACQQMHLSYSKGWNCIHNMEEQLGYMLVLRQQGGTYGGSSQLTSRGQNFLKQYEAYRTALIEQADYLFRKFFP